MTMKKTIPTWTTKGLKEWLLNFKDDDNSNNQVGFGDFAFLGSHKEDNVEVLLYKNEVANFIEALTVIEQINDYVDCVKTKQFTQYIIKKGLKEFPVKGK